MDNGPTATTEAGVSRESIMGIMGLPIRRSASLIMDTTGLAAITAEARGNRESRAGGIGLEAVAGLDCVKQQRDAAAPAAEALAATAGGREAAAKAIPAAADVAARRQLRSTCSMSNIGDGGSVSGKWEFLRAGVLRIDLSAVALTREPTSPLPGSNDPCGGGGGVVAGRDLTAGAAYHGPIRANSCAPGPAQQLRLLPGAANERGAMDAQGGVRPHHAPLMRRASAPFLAGTAIRSLLDCFSHVEGHPSYNAKAAPAPAAAHDEGNGPDEGLGHRNSSSSGSHPRSRRASATFAAVHDDGREDLGELRNSSSSGGSHKLRRASAVAFSLAHDDVGEDLGGHRSSGGSRPQRRASAKMTAVPGNFDNHEREDFESHRSSGGGRGSGGKEKMAPALSGRAHLDCPFDPDQRHKWK